MPERNPLVRVNTFSTFVDVVPRQRKSRRLVTAVRQCDREVSLACRSSRSAMETAVRNKFDLLISDIALPDGSGVDLMRQLRAISAIPGIAISGFGNNGDIERSLQAGFSEHLIKPIKLDDLEAAIERAIGLT